MVEGSRLSLRRLIFVSSTGIYDEVPGQSFYAALRPYRRGRCLSPAWLNDRDEIDYGTTQKREPFANPEGVVSRKTEDAAAQTSVPQRPPVVCSARLT